MNYSPKFPLGGGSKYCDHYDPSLLFAIPRTLTTVNPRLSDNVNNQDRFFFGIDIWNIYELCWLDINGFPQIAIATLSIPADSPNLIESKSLKLYINSFAQSQFKSDETLIHLIKTDLTQICGSQVKVQLTRPIGFKYLKISEMKGTLLDRIELDAVNIYTPDSSLLSAAHSEKSVEEILFSNLLRSNCPATGQPDHASIQIAYHGPKIDHMGLLRYIISYRTHSDFHEHCIERIFFDLLRECAPHKLSVYGRYTRRGGIDINPFRANFNSPFPKNYRTPRQ